MANVNRKIQKMPNSNFLYHSIMGHLCNISWDTVMPAALDDTANETISATMVKWCTYMLHCLNVVIDVVSPVMSCVSTRLIIVSENWLSQSRSPFDVSRWWKAKSQVRISGQGLVEQNASQPMNGLRIRTTNLREGYECQNQIFLSVKMTFTVTWFGERMRVSAIERNMTTATETKKETRLRFPQYQDQAWEGHLNNWENKNPLWFGAVCRG